MIDTTGNAATDAVAFTREVLGLEVQAHQAEALLCAKRRVTIAAGRRSGKSWCAQDKAIHICMTQRGVQVLVVHTDRDKGREWLRECVDLLGRSDLARGVEVDEQSQVLRFPGSGSEIVVVAGTAKSPRGFGRRVALVVIEEASYQPAALWPAIRYTLLDNQAQVWLVGTPDCAFEHFFRQSFELGMSGDPDYAAFSWRSSQNALIPRDEIDKESARLTEAERLSQLEGVWTDMEGAFLSRDLLRRQTVDELELPALNELGDGISLGMGLDYGGGAFDLSAAVGLARVPVSRLNSDRPGVPRFVPLVKVFERRALLPEVAEEIMRWPLRYAWLSSEMNGVGTGPSQMLRRSDRMRRRVRLWNLIQTDNKRKLAGYTALKWLLENDQLVLPAHPDLQRQLAGLKFERGERGFTRIEAGDPAVHDDVADGLMLGMAPYVLNGNTRCHALDLADPQNAAPDAVVPNAGGEEIVTTGGGLRVWRRPPLQSVAGGQELELPAGWGDAERVADSTERIGRFVFDRRYSRR